MATRRDCGGGGEGGSVNRNVESTWTDLTDECGGSEGGSVNRNVESTWTDLTDECLS